MTPAPAHPLSYVYDALLDVLEAEAGHRAERDEDFLSRVGPAPADGEAMLANVRADETFQGPPAVRAAVGEATAESARLRRHL